MARSLTLSDVVNDFKVDHASLCPYVHQRQRPGHSKPARSTPRLSFALKTSCFGLDRARAEGKRLGRIPLKELRARPSGRSPKLLDSRWRPVTACSKTLLKRPKFLDDDLTLFHPMMRAGNMAADYYFSCSIWRRQSFRRPTGLFCCFALPCSRRCSMWAAL
jgi:hypothetical protein